MATFEWIIVLLLGAGLLAALARRLGAPYPTFLAIGGALLAFVPASPNWTLDPHLALTLFVAPVLVDAAYDTSLRDLRANWRPVAGLVVAAVGTTVLAVALTARWLVPEMPWPVAIVAIRALERFHRAFLPKVEPVVTAYSAGLLAFSQTLDLSAIRNAIGWTPRVSFDEGLARTFARGFLGPTIEEM